MSSKPNIGFNTFWRPVLSIRKISESPPIKPSLIYDSGSGIVLKAKESLQHTQSMPSIPHDITKFCWLHVARWEYHIHVDSASVQCWNIITYSFFFFWLLLRLIYNKISTSNFNRKSIGHSTNSYALFLQIFTPFSSLQWCDELTFSLKENY